MDNFRQSGNVPSLNYKLHMFAIVPARLGNNCLTSHVCAGSKEQCLDGDLVIVFVTSSAVVSRNCESTDKSLLLYYCGWIGICCRLADCINFAAKVSGEVFGFVFGARQR